MCAQPRAAVSRFTISALPPASSAGANASPRSPFLCESNEKSSGPMRIGSPVLLLAFTFATTIPGPRSEPTASRISAGSISRVPVSSMLSLPACPGNTFLSAALAVIVESAHKIATVADSFMTSPQHRFNAIEKLGVHPILVADDFLAHLAGGIDQVGFRNLKSAVGAGYVGVGIARRGEIDA